MNHTCKEKERLDIIRSPFGQLAYGYYSDWMRANGRSIPPSETFIHSTFFTTFVKFTKHAQKVHMPAPHVFIKTMVEQKIQPTLWCRDNVYAMYMSQFEKSVPPDVQFVDSVDFLMDFALRYEVESKDAFNAMGIERFLVNVQSRKLSPWFLAASSVFRNWIKTLEPMEQMQVEDAVKVGALMIRIRSNPEMSKLFSDFCKACKEFEL